jgi:hypothetical protein
MTGRNESIFCLSMSLLKTEVYSSKELLNVKHYINGKEFVSSTINFAEGKAGKTIVKCFNLPCLVSLYDQEKRYVHPDFGAYLHDQLFNGNNLPIARQKGVFKKVFVCPNCLNIIEDQTTTQALLKNEIIFPHDNTPSFYLELETQALYCQSCEMRCLKPDKQLASDILDSLTNAFEQCGINP